MMATVSELSMYQAAAMKLQQQKRTASTKLEESKWRVANDEPPTNEVSAELILLESAPDCYLCWFIKTGAACPEYRTGKQPRQFLI